MRKVTALHRCGKNTAANTCPGSATMVQISVTPLEHNVCHVLTAMVQVGTLRHRVGKWLARVTQRVDDNSRAGSMSS